jgi:hypothetical protein
LPRSTGNQHPETTTKTIKKFEEYRTLPVLLVAALLLIGLNFFNPQRLP